MTHHQQTHRHPVTATRFCSLNLIIFHILLKTNSSAAKVASQMNLIFHAFPPQKPLKTTPIDHPQPPSAILKRLVEERWPKPRVAIPAIPGHALEGVHRRNRCARFVATGWRHRVKSQPLSSLNLGMERYRDSEPHLNPHSPRYAHHQERLMICTYLN